MASLIKSPVAISIFHHEVNTGAERIDHCLSKRRFRRFRIMSIVAVGQGRQSLCSLDAKHKHRKQDRCQSPRIPRCLRSLKVLAKLLDGQFGPTGHGLDSDPLFTDLWNLRPRRPPLFFHRFDTLRSILVLCGRLSHGEITQRADPSG